jgi:peroxiredoxin (alkyl hydroperoxide reductase subunit C)
MKSFTGPLKLGEVVPYLNLPSVRDGQVSIWDLRQRRNLVLVFFHGTYCLHCIAKLKEIAEAYEKLDDLEAEILAISRDNLEKLRMHAKRIGIPFHLLSDERGETIERFTYIDPAGNIPFPSVLITDRFGVLRYQEIVSEAHELIDVKEILSWLLLLQTECPECSHL